MENVRNNSQFSILNFQFSIMFLTATLQGPAGYEEDSAAVDSNGANLGALLQQYAAGVEACLINGRLIANWRAYIPQKSERVRLVLKTEAPALFAPFCATIFATTAAVTVASTVTSIVVSMAVSMAISAIIRSLTPNPKAPKLDGSSGQ